MRTSLTVLSFVFFSVASAHALEVVTLEKAGPQPVLAPANAAVAGQLPVLETGISLSPAIAASVSASPIALKTPAAITAKTTAKPDFSPSFAQASQNALPDERRGIDASASLTNFYDGNKIVARAGTAVPAGAAKANAPRLWRSVVSKASSWGSRAVAAGAVTLLPTVSFAAERGAAAAHTPAAAFIPVGILGVMAGLLASIPVTALADLFAKDKDGLSMKTFNSILIGGGVVGGLGAIVTAAIAPNAFDYFMATLAGTLLVGVIAAAIGTAVRSRRRKRAQ